MTDSYVHQHVVRIPLNYYAFDTMKQALRFVYDLMPTFNQQIKDHQAESRTSPDEYIECDLISELFELDQQLGFLRERHVYTDVPIILYDVYGDEPVRVFMREDTLHNFLDIALANWDKKDPAIYEEFALNDKNKEPIDHYNAVRFVPEAVAKNEAKELLQQVWYDNIRGKTFEDFYKPTKHGWFRQPFYFSAHKSRWIIDR